VTKAREIVCVNDVHHMRAQRQEQLLGTALDFTTRPSFLSWTRLLRWQVRAKLKCYVGGWE